MIAACPAGHQLAAVTARFLPRFFTLKKSFFVRRMSTKSVLALLTEGTEEMELVISVDVLRRAGVNVTIAGLGPASVYKCSRGVLISADMTLDDALSKGPYDVVLLPGGPGHKDFSSSEKVGSILKEQEKSGRLIAAICAAPVALKAHNICTNKKVTCYPSVKDAMLEGGVYTYVESKVVVDGNLITSQGPGTAYDFGLAVAEQLLGKDAVTPVAKALLL